MATYLIVREVLESCVVEQDEPPTVEQAFTIECGLVEDERIVCITELFEDEYDDALVIDDGIVSYTASELEINNAIDPYLYFEKHEFAEGV